MPNRKFILIFFISAFISLNVQAFSTQAKSAILFDIATDQILYEKNIYKKQAPSSMSKLMTLYVLFDKLRNGEVNLTTKIIVSEKAWRKKGSKMFLSLGSRVTIEDLIKGIIVLSGNDACIALAEGLMGSEEAYVQLMNEKASEIGLQNSHFKNTTGWPENGHEMTLYDIAILSKKIILEFPEFMHYFSQQEFEHGGIKQQNRNSLLGRDIGVDGLKTGHTEIAGYGISATAKQGDRRIIAVVNGLNSNAARTREAERLLQFGFLRFANFIIPETKKLAEININSGNQNKLGLKISEPVKLSLKKELINKTKVRITKKNNINAPIEKNSVLGKIEIIIPGKEPIVKELLAMNNIKKSNIIMDKLRQLKKRFF